MNNLGRTLRMALRYRATFLASVACALFVAVLWGGNISVIYPFVEVIFRGQAMPDWIDEKIADGEAAIFRFREEIDQLESALAAEPAADDGLRKHLQAARARLDAEQEALERARLARPYIHDYLPTKPFQTLLLIIGALVIGTLIKDVFLFAGAMFVARLAEQTTLDLRVEFYRRMLYMDLSRFNAQSRGDLMNRFTSDVQSLSVGLETLFGRAVREPLKMLACLGGAALVCWRLLLLSLVVAPLAVWLVSRLSRSLKRANHRAMEEMSQIYNTLSETSAGIKAVKAFTMEETELARFRQTAGLYFRKAMRIARYNALVRPLTELMGIVIISLAILAGAYLALNQETHLFGFLKMSERPLELGKLLLFYGLLAGVSDPARKLSDVFSRMQRAAAAADRVFEVLDSQPQVTDPPQPKTLERHRRELTFEDVHFSYTSEKPVLTGINLRIVCGERIAIVGHNGCGKSTLANLVLRFFDPARGAVKLDGVDLRQVRVNDLRNQIGLVNQETLLFDDTVAANIRYGALDASDADVEAAARQAHAHEFITEKLADGYHTLVGPGGGRLSGGQRQRIALARAILRNPAILILDEATSQIDLESEQLIHEVLQEFTRGRTTIFITHRSSTLALADRIVVMDHGRITDVGPHQELLGRSDFYRRMWQLDLKESA